jgi:hypothetical protein
MGKMHVHEGNVNAAKKYLDMLKTVLAPSADMLGISDDLHFMQDNAPIQGEKCNGISQRKQLLKECLLMTDVDVNISYKYFVDIWNSQVPYIRIMCNGSDFCDYCTFVLEQNRIDLSMREIFEQHRLDAKRERCYYYEQCKLSRETFSHITFDYAQSVQLPFFLRQRGFYYFMVGLRVRIFGIACDSTNKEMNYLLPEVSYPCTDRGGGPNVIISLLHHYFQNYYQNRKKLSIHADSCSGQNKNQYLFYYFIWRIITGLDDEIEFSFMIPGHTKKCVPDQNFGNIKSRFANCDVRSMKDLHDVVNRSNVSNQAHDCTVKKPNFYDWKTFLHKFFNRKGVPHIKSNVQSLHVKKEGNELPVYLKTS